MIAAAFLLAALQPLPSHPHGTHRPDRAWREAALKTPPRGATRLRALRLAVRTLDDAPASGPSGL